MSINYIVKGPKFRTAKQLVSDGTFPFSQTTLLSIARKGGVGRKAGRTVIFSDEDISRLYESMPWHSNLFPVAKAPTSTYEGLSVDKASKKLQALLIKKKQK